MIDWLSYFKGEWFLVYVPKSWENRSLLIGEGDKRYYGCFLNGVKVVKTELEKVS